MVDVRELYPGKGDDDSYFCIGDYQPMVDAFGKILIQVDGSDYQGDTFVWYEKDGCYGFLSFGWGSCSGCDSLQACDSMGEVQELADALEQSIEWFDSKDAAARWFREKDWQGHWFWHTEEAQDFLKQLGAELGIPPWEMPKDED